MAPRKIVLASVALALVVAGVALRIRDLGKTAFWVDEAESAIDALTILEHGVPVGHHLGEPLFENTLLESHGTTATAAAATAARAVGDADEPDSEYELHDPSFANRDLAAYHGWLPLYSMAAAMKLGGIGSDVEISPPRVVHGVAEMTRRSVVPRVPAVAFALVFLIALWRLGAALGGEEVGVAVVAVAALAHRIVWFGQQARYYSATLALTAATALALVQASRRGRWRDFLLAALLGVLLFHTHSLSFLILGVASPLLLPQLMSAPHAATKFATALTLVAIGTLPWALYCGFFGVASALPRAWELLDFPRDAFLLRSATAADLAAVGLAAIVVAIATLGMKLAPPRLRAAILVTRAPLRFTGAWFVVAAIAFPLVIPAPSYSDDRAVLMVAIPALLFAAIGLATLLQWAAPRVAPALLLAGAAAYLLASGQLRASTEGTAMHRVAKREALSELIGELELRDFAPGARFFGTPNDHLVLTWYTGLPVQSVAPVRRSFFEQPPCDVYVLELTERFNTLRPSVIEEEARAAGVELSADEAARLAEELGALHVAHDLANRGARVLPPPEEPTPLLARLFARQSELTRANATRIFERIPMLRGFQVADWLDFWPLYSYRFANPGERRAAGPNYASLYARSTARVLPSSYVILACTR